jgi:hypothetical protein
LGLEKCGIVEGNSSSLGMPMSLGYAIGFKRFYVSTYLSIARIRALEKELSHGVRPFIDERMSINTPASNSF